MFVTPPPTKATERLVMMVEKHGITAVPEFVDPSLSEDGDLSREANVLVLEADYERAYRLVYEDKENEL